MLTRLRGGTATDTIWALGSEVMMLLTMMATFLLLGSRLGPSTYGAYVAVFALVAPVSAFTHSGVTLAVFEHVAKDGESIKRVARSCFTIVLGLGLAFAVVVGLIAALTVNGMEPGTAILLVVTEMVLASVTHTMAAIVQVGVGFPLSARFRIVFHGTRLAVVVSLAVAGELTLLRYALVNLGATALVGLVAIAVASRYLGFQIRPGRPERRHVRSVAIYSGGISAAGVQNDGDKYVLNVSGHVAEGGNYAAAYRLVQMGFMPVAALISATHVSFLDGGETDQVKRATRLAGFAFVYGIVLAIGLVIAAPVVPRILGSEYEETVQIIRWLSPLVALRAVSTFPMNGLLGLGRNDLRTTLQMINALGAVILYIVLIPPFGWKGAAVATTISEVSVLFLAWWSLLTWARRARESAPEPAFEVGP